MKNRSITYLLLFGICSMLAIMQSCQKTDDLEADINSLKDRVAALEKATEGLNTSIASLQALMQKNKIIIGITPTKDGLGYLLELSDGTSIKVMESEAVQASVPEFSVDEEGYWIYKTSNNTNFKYLPGADGEKVSAWPRDEEGNVIGTSRAIDEVDIEAKEGQFIAVLGHNGSGKSTLAKHLNAILVPTEGSVWVNGKNTSNPEELWDVRQSAGMVFQNPDNQIIGTVVEEDVGFGPENLGVPTDEIWQRVEESLKAVGMIEYRHHSPNKLSGGQKQRVAIAGVVAMEPKCIVMDEPTAMLDPVGRKEVLKTVHKLRKQKNVTVILITHYMEEVVDADKIFVMDHGKVVMEGTPKEIFSRVDELKSYRLDVPQVTILADELRKRGLDIPKGILRKEELVEAITHLQQ